MVINKTTIYFFYQPVPSAPQIESAKNTVEDEVAVVVEWRPSKFMNGPSVHYRVWHYNLYINQPFISDKPIQFILFEEFNYSFM